MNTRSPIYESINFDASLVAHSNQLAQSAKTNKLQRQSAFDDSQQTHDVQTQNNRNTNRDIIDFLNRCIPPPPNSTPPPRNIDSEIYSDPIEISANTLERLNSLYGFCKNRDAITPESEDGVVYRFREFDHFSPRSFRGSSRAMCSFASVLIFIGIISSIFCHNLLYPIHWLFPFCSIVWQSGEESYLTCLEDDEIESAKKRPYCRSADKSMSNTYCDKPTENMQTEQMDRREQSLIHTQNDEVFIWMKHEISISLGIPNHEICAQIFLSFTKSIKNNKCITLDSIVYDIYRTTPKCLM